ncbi:MAG: hypothetical protein QOD01_2963 [Actinomycetota bacterium]|jgi:hypothetical protein|nr:hypothetical protein [Actinomycetota bacterium]
MSDGEAKGRGNLRAWIGAAVGIISAVGVLYGIFHHPDTSVTDYQKQVQAMCVRTHGILTTDHAEIFRFDPSVDPTSPSEFLMVDKAALVRVAKNNMESIKQEFKVLDEQTAPKALQAQKEAVIQAELTYEAGLQREVQFIEANVRDGMTLRQVNDLGAESNATQISAKAGLNGALTALAGSECTVTRP